MTFRSHGAKRLRPIATSELGVAEPNTGQLAENCGGSAAAISTLLSIKDVEAIFGRCQHTIRRWIKQGKLPARYVGRSVFICAEDVSALINKSIMDRVLADEIPASREGSTHYSREIDAAYEGRS